MSTEPTRADLPLGHEFEPPPGVAMTDPAYDECTHRADAIGTVCGAPDGAHDPNWAWCYDPNVVRWDWREQPDLDQLARLLDEHGVTLTKIDTGGDEYAVRVSTAETAPGMPRPTAVEPVEPPAGPERGTGEPETHRGAEAIEGLANEFSPSLAEIAAWANAARREIDAAHFDIKTAIERIAKTMRPIHLHEAAASLRAIADHMPDTASARELRPGIEYAATLLRHIADDEEGQ